MDGWQSHGDVLRWWRTNVADLSQRDLAERLAVGRTAVANWENGTRMASIEIDQIDEAIGAKQTLAGLLWAFGSPQGIEPGKLWTNVFPGDSTVVWMWLRGPADLIEIEAEWGVFRMEAKVEPGPNGVFVTVGASVDQSPVIVRTGSPTWVDFGRGELPEEVDGAPVLSAVDLMKPGSVTGDFARTVCTNIAEQFTESLSREVADLGEDARKPVESFVHDIGPTIARQVGQPWPGVGEGIDEVERSRFIRMRQARAISLPETARRLGEVTGAKASKDTLRRFESGKGEPHDPLLPIALDHVLGGNGHLALTRISSGQGEGAVFFPRYWLAPVWLSFEGAEEKIVGELQWGNWRRRLEGELPMLVISHSPLTPLRIVVPSTVKWTAGVGRRNGAIPINHGWAPGSVDTANEALSSYQDVLFDAVRHSSEHPRT